MLAAGVFRHGNHTRKVAQAPPYCSMHRRSASRVDGRKMISVVLLLVSLRRTGLDFAIFIFFERRIARALDFRRRIDDLYALARECRQPLPLWSGERTPSVVC